MLAGHDNRWNNYLLRRARGEMQEFGEELTRALQSGELLLPSQSTPQPILAGGQNHCPNSDLSYSLAAATTAGILPATAGDPNHECYRFFRQQVGANVDATAAGALKATAHSLFAANEGATAALPRWDRVNGWLEIGAAGATQYDIAIQLHNNVVSAGQRWFVRFRCAALNAALVPADVQAFAGIWQKTSGSEGYLQGNNFTVLHQIVGPPGAQAIEYRILAKTDSGLTMLSDVLAIANAPAVLSANNYIKLFFATAGGFIEYQVYRKQAGLFYHVYTIRNSSDLQYNDTGGEIGRVENWPAAGASGPRAYAQTEDFMIAPFGGVWSPNDLTIVVPPSYDYTQTSAFGQFLRIGLTAPTSVDRHLGIDRIYFSTTYNEWSPDEGIYPSPPSVSPTSGNQGSGGGVFAPPDDGSGGGTCVRVQTPVLTVERGRLQWRQFQSVRVGALVKGEQRAPYLALKQRTGTVSEYYRIETANGITLECSAEHRLIADLATGERLAAKHVEVGARLACWVKGRRTKTRVVSVKLVPQPAEVGTFTLRDLTGGRRDGDGLYIAGRSRGRDRGLFSHNRKALLLN